MKNLIKFELRKILTKRFAVISVAAVLLLSLILSFSTLHSMYAFDGNGAEETGKAAVEIDKQIALKYEGKLTDNKVQQMMSEFKPTQDLHGMNAKYIYQNALQSSVFSHFADIDGNWNGLSVADVFGDKEIKVGNKLNLYFEESKQNLTFIIPEGSFISSCPLLDVTFVEIPQGTFQNVDYLRVCESPIEGQKIYIIKYSSEGDLSHVEGNILNYYGTDFTFNISEGNDEKEFYGSAIISLSKISLGDVLGLDKGIFLIKNAKNKLATNINVILDAIRCLTHRNMVNPKETLPPARKLVNEDLTILSNKGLQPTDNPYYSFHHV